MRRILNFFIVSLDFSLLLLLLMTWADAIIGTRTEDFITSDLSEVPSAKVGLLLGTSKTLRGGAPNDYFFNRIDAAVALYQSGKIKYILVSGDNSNASYNEPKDMRDELMLRGVPESAIILDYAGFRTLDSILRAERIFGQKTFIVISQRFHNERAVFLARKMDIEAYGYNAKDVSAYFAFKTNVREFFARSKVFLDLLFNVEPKFWGEKVVID